MSIQVELLYWSRAVVFAFQNCQNQSLQECRGRKDIGKERTRKIERERELYVLK
jgi:hypothetical protein